MSKVTWKMLLILPSRTRAPPCLASRLSTSTPPPTCPTSLSWKEHNMKPFQIISKEHQLMFTFPWSLGRRGWARIHTCTSRRSSSSPPPSWSSWKLCSRADFAPTSPPQTWLLSTVTTFPFVGQETWHWCWAVAEEELRWWWLRQGQWRGVARKNQEAETLLSEIHLLHKYIYYYPNS